MTKDIMFELYAIYYLTCVYLLPWKVCVQVKIICLLYFGRKQVWQPARYWKRNIRSIQIIW